MRLLIAHIQAVSGHLLKNEEPEEHGPGASTDDAAAQLSHREAFISSAQRFMVRVADKVIVRWTACSSVAAAVTAPPLY